MQLYRDRREAGALLGEGLKTYQKERDTIVLGLPRGGVVVAEQVARVLGLPLDVILLRKLPYPPQPELAVGAVAEHGAVFVNEEFQDAVREDPSWLEEIVRDQQEIIRKRATLYRPHRHARDLKGKTVILVDDGIATGATMKVAIRAARAAGAAQVVVAIPVAAPPPSESWRLKQTKSSVWIPRIFSTLSAKPTNPSTKSPMKRFVIF